MRRQGQKWAAAAGGAALIVALWAPWFSRRLAGGIAGLRAVSGWRALGPAIGVAVLAAGGAAIAWALGRRSMSGAWLVVPGALALLAETSVTVARIGVDNAGSAAAVTTSPAAGLALAFLGAAAVVLTGLIALMRP